MNTTKVPDFKAGDIIKVFTKDPKGAKIHSTPFEGVVLAVKGQKGKQTFTVRKNSYNQVAVERIFPINSPIIEKVQLLKKGNVRRSKLYHLRRNNAKAGFKF